MSQHWGHDFASSANSWLEPPTPKRSSARLAAGALPSKQKKHHTLTKNYIELLGISKDYPWDGGINLTTLVCSMLL